MKKMLLPLVFLLTSCTAQKQFADNSIVFSKHPKPYRIFSVGNWQSNYVILTLIDADKKYFTVKVIDNGQLKPGTNYSPL